MPQITIPVSVGEFLDRLSILRLKAERLSDPTARAACGTEANGMVEKAELAGILASSYEDLLVEITQLNGALWDLGNAVRAAHRRNDAQAISDLSMQIIEKNAQKSRLKAIASGEFSSRHGEFKEYGASG